ncbi:MAG: glycosyltransferase family 4 protein [Thermodesulfobacteriota bacterium]
MTWLLIALIIGTFWLSWLVTRQWRAYALKRNVLDRPNYRSSHTQPTPRGGGLGLATAFEAALAALYLAGHLSWAGWLALAPAAALVAGIGFWDDHQPLPAYRRLLAQLAAAVWALAWWPALRESGRMVAPWLPAWLWLILILLGLLWLTNLYNFMDGIDGLAGLEAVSTAGVAGLLLGLDGQTGPALSCWALAAASAGFLYWNWPPAVIFMGDVGSGFIGFVLGVLALISAAQEPKWLAVWIILLGVFEVDATITLLRRMIRGARWYEAHREHAYQHSARRWGHRRVTMTVLGLNIFCLAPAAVLVLARPGLAGLVAALVLLLLVALVLWGGAGTKER